MIKTETIYITGPRSLVDSATQYLEDMQTNLYGPGDNYHPDNSHVIPALICKFHEAKVSGAPTVTVWGSGTPRREFMYSEDMADACVYLMNLPDEQYTSLLGSDESKSGKFEPPLINIGVGHDVTIKELAETIQAVVWATPAALCLMPASLMARRGN